MQESLDAGLRLQGESEATAAHSRSWRARLRRVSQEGKEMDDSQERAKCLTAHW